jgi:membrane-associated phospholipid phosphatase
MTIDEYVLHALDQIGKYGRYIAGASSTIILYKLGKPVALGYYILGAIFCTIVNIILKIIIKQPRPKNDKPDFAFLVQNNKKVSFDKFGMPSGHSQFMFYTLAFMAFATYSHKHYWWTIAFLLMLTINTVVQRIVDDHHTMLQVVVGAITGTLIGIGAFYITKSKLKGKTKSKEDDNALFMA